MSPISQAAGPFPNSPQKGVDFLAPTTLATGIFICLTVFIGLSPAIFGNYAIFDDCRFLLDYGWEGKSHFSGVMIAEGRPLYALLAEAGFKQLVWISGLRWLRLSAVLFAVAAVLFLFHCSRKKVGPMTGAAIGAAVILSPGGAIYAFWAACFPYLGAVLLSLIGGWLWTRPSGWKGRMAGIILTLAALFIYQPAALFFLLGGIVRHSGSETKAPSLHDPRILGIVGVLLSLVIYFILFRGYMVWFAIEDNRSGRLDLFGAFERTGVLFTALLPQVFKNWGALFGSVPSLLFQLVQATGVALYIWDRRTTWSAWAASTMIVIALLGVAAIPFLISGEGLRPSRILAPLFAVIGGLTVLGWHRFLEPFKWARPLVMGAFCLLLAGFTFAGGYWGHVEPRERETAALRQAAAEEAEALPPGLTIIRPSARTRANDHLYHVYEYGIYELTVPMFSVEWAILNLLEAEGMLPGDLEGTAPINAVDVLLIAPDAATVPPIYPVIDMRRVLQGLDVSPIPFSTGEKRVHERIGEVAFHPPAYFISDWFGMFYELNHVWIRHQEHGWLSWGSESAADPVVAYDAAGRRLEFFRPNDPASGEQTPAAQ